MCVVCVLHIKPFFLPVDQVRNVYQVQLILQLRGAIVIRTYGTYKNLHIQRFLTTIFGPITYGPP